LKTLRDGVSKETEVALEARRTSHCEWRDVGNYRVEIKPIVGQIEGERRTYTGSVMLSVGYVQQVESLKAMKVFRSDFWSQN
jgi:hypothetical protein